MSTFWKKAKCSRLTKTYRKYIPTVIGMYHVYILGNRQNARRLLKPTEKYIPMVIGMYHIYILEKGKNARRLLKPTENTFQWSLECITSTFWKKAKCSPLSKTYRKYIPTVIGMYHVYILEKAKCSPLTKTYRKYIPTVIGMYHVYILIYPSFIPNRSKLYHVFKSF